MRLSIFVKYIEDFMILLLTKEAQKRDFSLHENFREFSEWSRNPIFFNFSYFFLALTRTDAAFGGWGEDCGAKLASVAFEGTSPPVWPPTADLAKKISDRKKSEAENFSSM